MTLKMTTEEMNAKCDNWGGGKLYYKGKGEEEWRDSEKVQKLDKIRSEGLEAWDEVSHFNAKKAYLLQAR